MHRSQTYLRVWHSRGVLLSPRAERGRRIFCVYVRVNDPIGAAGRGVEDLHTGLHSRSETKETISIILKARRVRRFRLSFSLVLFISIPPTNKNFSPRAACSLDDELSISKACQRIYQNETIIIIPSANTRKIYRR